MNPKLQTGCSILAGGLILVTGATGFTGRNLVSHLAKNGARIRATARHTSDVTCLQGLPVEWIRGELHDPEYIRKAMDGVSYVFHLATAFRETFRPYQEQYNVHVASTKLLAAEAARQPGFRRFVHVSTIGVHGHVESPPGDENCPFAPGDTYQQTKLEAEQWILAHGRNTGLPVTVVRPAGIFGPGDDRLLKIFRMASRRLVPVVGRGKHLLHLIHVDDLVRFMVLVADHPKALNEVFICGNKDPISLETIIAIASREYGIRNRIVRIPVAPVMAAAVVCDRICSPLGIQPPIFPRRVAFFTKDRAFDTSKIRRVLDFQTYYDNESGITQMARWYRDHAAAAG